MTSATSRSTYPGAGGVPVGAAVATRYFNELGHVKEVQPDHFKVDARMKRDYWLTVDSIGDYREGCVIVNFDESELDTYRLSEPKGRVADPIADARIDTFDSGAEKAARREEMVEGYGHVSEENLRLDTDPYRTPPTDSGLRGAHQHLENIHGVIAIDADVLATGDEKVGTVSRVIVDPETDTMHSIVVKSGGLLSHERIVPLTCVSGGDGEALRLDMGKDAFESCDLFDAGRWRTPDPDYNGPPGFDRRGMGNNFQLNNMVAMGSLMGLGQAAPPLGYPGGEPARSPSTESELAVGEGSEVYDCDGVKVGEVARLEVDPRSGRISRLTVRQGHLFHHDTDVVPDAIQEMGDNRIVLNVAGSSLPDE